MMIKGSLLLSAAIVKHYQARKKQSPVCFGPNLPVLGSNISCLILNLSFITQKRHILA